MRRVLVVRFSQTGQLDRVVDSIVGPLLDCPEIEVVFEELRPLEPFPFPWPFLQFFSIFPECIHMVPQPMAPYSLAGDEEFDLIVLAYQVWFLAPALPTTSFLRSELAERLFRDRPVVTVIACRGMWLMAQEKVKSELARLGARLVDNVALIDSCGSVASFLATPLWMFTGKKQPYSWIPPAGVGEREIAECRRFGEPIRNRLCSDATPIASPMLRGLGAVSINDKLIASERIGNRSFRIWGSLLRALGGPETILRRAALILYILVLAVLLLTVAPITAGIRALIAPVRRQRIAMEKAYFAAPSGE